MHLVFNESNLSMLSSHEMMRAPVSIPWGFTNRSTNQSLDLTHCETGVSQRVQYTVYLVLRHNKSHKYKKNLLLCFRKC